MNDIVTEVLLAGDKFIPEMRYKHLYNLSKPKNALSGSIYILFWVFKIFCLLSLFFVNGTLAL